MWKPDNGNTTDDNGINKLYSVMFWFNQWYDKLSIKFFWNDQVTILHTDVVTQFSYWVKNWFHSEKWKKPCDSDMSVTCTRSEGKTFDWQIFHGWKTSTNSFT